MPLPYLALLPLIFRFSYTYPLLNPQRSGSRVAISLCYSDGNSVLIGHRPAPGLYDNESQSVLYLGVGSCRGNVATRSPHPSKMISRPPRSIPYTVYVSCSDY